MTNPKKIAVWTAIAALALAAGWTRVPFVLPGHSGVDPQRMAAKIASFSITVNTIGVLDAERSYNVSSAIKGDNGKIVYLVDEGTLVRKGDPLVKFDSAYFEAEILRLTGELRSREATIEARKQILEWEKSQADGAIKAAEFDMNDAMQEHSRYLSYIKDMEDLGKKGLSYPNEITQAKKKADQLLAKQQKQEMLLHQTSKESAFKIAAAMAELAKTKAEIETTGIALANIRDEFGKAVVYAPFQGIVVHSETHRDNQKRKPRVGDTVWQNQPLLYLPDISSMIVKTLVREVDLHKITKGQKASVTVDAYPDRVLSGQVTAIGVMASDAADTGKGDKYFQVVVALQGDHPDLRPGMTSRVAIHVDTARDALCVPVQAVFGGGESKYCFVGKGPDATRVAVKTGRQNEDYAEIVSGLKPGDRVSLVKPAGDDVKP